MRLYPKNLIRKSYKYYAFELTCSPKDKITIGSQTKWVGFADEDYRAELRKPREVDPYDMAESWEGFQTPFMVVNTRDDFYRWFFNGGNALLNKRIAKRIVPEWLESSQSVQSGFAGFKSVEDSKTNVFQRAPTPKLRMKVLKRDDYRCKICGRRSSEDVDIVLHVHHIKPHASRGATHEDNLITLCHTCHSGLDPHYEWSLFELVDQSLGGGIDAERRRYLEGVSRYRRLMLKKVKQASNKGTVVKVK